MSTRFYLWGGVPLVPSEANSISLLARGALLGMTGFVSRKSAQSQRETMRMRGQCASRVEAISSPRLIANFNGFVVSMPISSAHSASDRW